MGIDFFQTNLGRKFYEADVPRIAKSLELIASAIEKQNELTERRIELDEKAYASTQPPPDRLHDLVGPFMASAGGPKPEDAPFATQDREPPKLDVKSQLYRWHARWTPTGHQGVSKEALEALYHLVMTNLPRWVSEVDDDADPATVADSLVLGWLQGQTRLEVDSKAHSELVNVIVGLIADERGENA